MVRTAGMVQGTPDWQLDRIYETETAKKLEEMYAEDDFPISSIEDEFSTARSFLGQAVNHLIRAANEAEKFGKDKPIDELIALLDDDIPYRMRKLVREWKGLTIL